MTAEPGLRRELGLVEVTLSGVGIILGAGIYALVGVAAEDAGNALWAAFLFAAVASALTGLSYAALSNLIPKAAAEYDYVRPAWGDWPAFLTGWAVIAGSVIAIAPVALGFGGYLQSLTPLDQRTGAWLLIGASTLVALWGVRESVWLSVVFTLIELSGLALVIAVGLPHVGDVDYFESPEALPGVLRATALVFFAYIGFQHITKLSEETRDADRVIPMSVGLALGVAAVFYGLVALTAVSVSGWETLAASDAPLADVVRDRLGDGGSRALSVIALFATGNTVLLLIVSMSRIVYGMAQEGALPAPLGSVLPGRRTPGAATVAISLAGAALVAPGDIEVVAGMTNFMIFLSFIAVNGALLTLRWRTPPKPGRFQVTLRVGRLDLVPLAGLAGTFLMVSYLKMEELLWGGLALAIGAAVRLIWRGGASGPAQPDEVEVAHAAARGDPR
ncbi:MAG TPA: APC family permease [Dehalococcoidia bacterium]|nr:APC family permease [Dehalococcoidia bacterium]